MSRAERRRFEKEWEKDNWPAWHHFFTSHYEGEELDAALGIAIMDIETITAQKNGMKYVAQLNCWKCDEVWVGPPGPGSGTCPTCGHLYCTWVNAEEIIESVKKERTDASE